MKGVGTIARIRREFLVRGKTIKEIVRGLHVSRNILRLPLYSQPKWPRFQTSAQPSPPLVLVAPRSKQ
jgi:hypothetical protein